MTKNDQQTHTVRVVEVCNDPTERSFEELTPTRVSAQPIGTLAGLKRRLARHTGPLDSPRPSPGVLRYFGAELLAGNPVAAFDLEIICQPCILRRPPPSQYFLCGLKSMSELLLIGAYWRPAYQLTGNGSTGPSTSRRRIVVDYTANHRPLPGASWGERSQRYT